MTATAISPPPTAEPEAAKSSRGLVDKVFRARELTLLVALVALVVGTQLSNSRFLSEQGVKDLFLNASILVLLAVGQSVVVVTRNIDLSVGSVVGLSAFACGKFASGSTHSVAAVALVGVLVGIACGVVNGLLVSLGRVPSLVVTLGTLYIIQGIDYYWAQGEQINAETLPRGVLDLGTGSVLGIPYLPLIAAVVLLLTGWYLRGYRTGRELYAIGSNPEAARLAGVPSARRVFTAYVFSGAIAGLAGALWLSRFGTVVADAANGWELQVVSAVVVGGVAITGGIGTVWGAALGALLLTTIGSALVVLKVDSFWQKAINGALLLAAISIDRIVQVRVTRALRKRNARHG
ncbi:ABC transporter permease [Streptodolium elevatio]|uniref:Autoinducer 2 import system permease protein LsrC n=1 Tax=Streptodolium elevatio TaxID=3157996 RepID=A0ABV3DER3_9ACTN